MSRETVRSDRGPRKRKHSNDGEFEDMRKCVHMSAHVSKTFEELFGSIRMSLAGDKCPKVLMYETEKELKDGLRQFMDLILKDIVLNEEDKTKLISYGMRAFVGIVGGICIQAKSSLRDMPLFRIFSQTLQDVSLLSAFQFKGISDEQVSLMCAGALFQQTCPDLNDSKTVDTFSTEVSSCLHKKLSLQLGGGATTALLSFNNILSKMYN